MDSKLYYIRNILSLFFVIIIINGALKLNGYNWLYTMLKDNEKFVKKNSELSEDKKNEIKHGSCFTYLNFLKTHTPDSAIILFPDKNTLLNIKEFKDSPSNSSTLRNPAWATYFIYPRRIIYADTLKKEYNATHIAIIDGHGYEHLSQSANTEQGPKFTVLSLTK